MDFVRLNVGESLEGKLKEAKHTKNKKGEDRFWCFLDCDGVEKIIPTKIGGTLENNIAKAGAKVGDKLKITYGNADGKNFYNVDKV